MALIRLLASRPVPASASSIDLSAAETASPVIACAAGKGPLDELDFQFAGVVRSNSVRTMCAADAQRIYQQSPPPTPPCDELPRAH